MCGIFGYIAKLGTPGLTREEIESCLGEISHRGPDARGLQTFSSPSIIGCLGHVRLSIVDLAGGKQPMLSADKNFLLSFNGEIYNYLSIKRELIEKGHDFYEESDTEVLLHAYQEWGVDCVSHFRGMFGFAVWDDQKEHLFIARDQFGKKPIFFTVQNDNFYFSSEIKSLQNIPKSQFSFNKEQVKNYLIYRYVPSPATLLKEVHKLPAGCYLIWKGGDFKVTSYFDPPDYRPSASNLNKRGAAQEFWNILDESVKLRMEADVPFGAFLSGGIDSSAIVALMNRHSSQKVKTFSIGFKESQYSELAYADVIAEHFETDHHEFIVSQDDLMALLPEVIAFRDAPVSEPSDIPIYLLAKEASKTVKMVLTGEGSDEVLAGYPKHSFERAVQPFQLIPRYLRNNIISPLINALPYKFRRAKTAIRNINCENYDERMPGWFGALSEKQATMLLNMPGQQVLPSLTQSLGQGCLHNILLFDQLSWLPDNLLERGDRMTMAASIEARMPFMDIELAKFAASLPDEYRIKGRTTKWILRKAMESILPVEILKRPKVGFRVPVNEWFRTTMKDYLCDHLLGATSISKIFYHQTVLKMILTEHISGEHNHEKILWTLLNLEIWLKQNQHRIEL